MAVRLAPHAQRDLTKLALADQDRVLEALEALEALDANRQGRHDVRKLGGIKDTWRLRVGSFRALFTFDRRSGDIVVQAIGDRKDVY